MKCKRLISLLLASALLFAMAPVSFAANDSMESATAITAGKPVSVTLESHTNYWYKFNAAAGQFIKLDGLASVSCNLHNTSGYTVGWYVVEETGVRYAMADKTGTYYLNLYSSKDQTVNFTLSLLDNDQYESNNTLSDAVPLELNKDHTIINTYYDYEWFSLDAEPGQILMVTADEDMYVNFYTAEDKTISKNYSGNQTWCFIPLSGTVYIRLHYENYSKYILPTTTSFSATLLENDSFEYNNTEDTAYQLTSGVPAEFQLGYYDVDWFFIPVRAGQDVQLDFSGFNHTTRGRFSFYPQHSNGSIYIEKNCTYYYHAVETGTFTFYLRDYYDNVNKTSLSTETFTVTATVLDGDAYEPNDFPADAKRLNIGTDAYFSMGGKGDEDWFTFEAVPDAGEETKLYTLNLMDLASDYADEFYYDLYDPSGTAVMTNMKVNIRHANVLSCAEGLYTLRLYRTSITTPRSQLRIRVDEGGADPYEANDTWLTAAPIQGTQTVQHILANTADRDWFKFQVPRANMTLSMSPDRNMYYRLYSAEDLEEYGVDNYHYLVSRDVSASGEEYYQFAEPGVYYLCLGTSTSYVSPDLRTLTLTLTDAQDNENNNTWQTATPIYESVPVHFDLTAWNDEDWFAIEVPEGLTQLRITGTGDGYYDRYLYRGKDFEYAGDDASSIASASNTNTILVNNPAAGTYYLQCRTYNYRTPVSDQTATVHFVTDPLPGQTIKDAKPITEGQWMTDVWGGYYALGALKSGDEVRIYVDNVYSVYLYNAAGEQKAWATDFDNTCLRIPSDGEYYLKVSPYYMNDDGSYLPYRFLCDIADRALAADEDLKLVGPITITVAVGETVQVDMRLAPYDAKWNSTGTIYHYHSVENTSVASAQTLTGYGYCVTGKAVGTTEVYYRFSNYSNTVYRAVYINVVDPTTTQSLTINNAPSALPFGTSVTLEAELTPATSTDTITWTSSDPQVLYVNDMGKVTAVGNGTATITAAASSGVTASATITVTEAPAKPEVTGLALDDYDLTMYMGEDGAQLTATIQPAGSTATVFWTSSNVAAATVDQTGKLTPVAPGVTVITASAGDYRASCVVTVQAERIRVDSIAFDTAVLEIPLGGESALRPNFNPVDATVQSMTWTTSDPNVASVSRTGIVNALAVGETTITATTLDGGKTASILIRVTAAPQLGDINGDGYIDAADAMVTLQVAVGKITLTDAQTEAADVNHDGWVDAADAVRILRYNAGLIDSLEN